MDSFSYQDYSLLLLCRTGLFWTITSPPRRWSFKPTVFNPHDRSCGGHLSSFFIRKLLHFHLFYSFSPSNGSFSFFSSPSSTTPSITLSNWSCVSDAHAKKNTRHQEDINDVPLIKRLLWVPPFWNTIYCLFVNESALINSPHTLWNEDLIPAWAGQGGFGCPQAPSAPSKSRRGSDRSRKCCLSRRWSQHAASLLTNVFVLLPEGGRRHGSRVIMDGDYWVSPDHCWNKGELLEGPSAEEHVNLIIQHWKKSPHVKLKQRGALRITPEQRWNKRFLIQTQKRQLKPEPPQKNSLMENITSKDLPSSRWSTQSMESVRCGRGQNRPTSSWF